MAVKKAKEPRAPQDLTAWWRANPEMAEKARKFQRKLTLDTGETWGDVLAPWSAAAYAQALGLPDAPAPEKRISEVCGVVGSGKDQIIAAAMLACLHFGPPGFVGLKQSVTKDKSAAVVKCANDFGFRDAKAVDGIQFTRGEIRADARNAIVVCGSLDGPSTAGVIYDLALLNEVQEWPAPDGVQVYGHIFARSGKKGGRLACFTNAPFAPKGDWRRDRWEEARRAGSDWWYLEVTVEMCPWISPTTLDLMRRNLPTRMYRRWFHNDPADGAGGLVTEEEVRRAVRDEMSAALTPAAAGLRFLGVDVGLARDHYVLVMLRLAPGNVVYLERVDVFIPPKGELIDLLAARDVIRHYGRTWGAQVLLDPFQAQQLGQELTAGGCDVVLVDPTAKNQMDMAHAVMDLFRDGRVRIYPSAGRVPIGEEGDWTDLARQLVDAEVKEDGRGYRAVSKRTKAGHGDQWSAFALAALGVARAGACSAPECGTSARRDAERAREGLRILAGGSRVSMGRHGGRFLGARAPRERKVLR